MILALILCLASGGTFTTANAQGRALPPGTIDSSAYNGLTPSELRTTGSILIGTGYGVATVGLFWWIAQKISDNLQTSVGNGAAEGVCVLATAIDTMNYSACVAANRPPAPYDNPAPKVMLGIGAAGVLVGLLLNSAASNKASSSRQVEWSPAMGPGVAGLAVRARF